MRRAWVDVDLGALRRNAATLARLAGRPLLPMVKADAYGLGALPVVQRALEPLAPWGYGVATIAEGAELREHGITRPIVVFTPLERGSLDEAARYSLTPVLGNEQSIELWAQIGGGPWHLGIDTGMNRAGVCWDEVHTLCHLLAAVPPEGACTHLHSAERDDESVAEQERRFTEAVARLPARPRLLHVENSAAITRREESPWDLARPGIFLYGVGSGGAARVAPEPVLALRARVVDLRTVHDGGTVSYDATYRAVGDRRIATLSVGYADGYVRALSNRGFGILHGRRVPVAGLVTMDMTMVDVTDAPCELGDVATLIGNGADGPDVETVAMLADMSPYELLTGLRGRLPKAYHDVRAGTEVRWASA